MFAQFKVSDENCQPIPATQHHQVRRGPGFGGYLDNEEFGGEQPDALPSIGYVFGNLPWTPSP